MSEQKNNSNNIIDSSKEQEFNKKIDKNSNIENDLNNNNEENTSIQILKEYSINNKFNELNIKLTSYLDFIKINIELNEYEKFESIYKLNEIQKLFGKNESSEYFIKLISKTIYNNEIKIEIYENYLKLTLVENKILLLKKKELSYQELKEENKYLKQLYENKPDTKKKNQIKNENLIMSKSVEIERNNSIYKESEFLEVRKLTIPKKENFEKYVINKYDKDKTEKLIEYILSINVSINKFNDNHSLSPLIPINKLIEEFNLKDNFNNIKYYRKIKEDGNSFYRIIIFQIFEFIILKNKIDLLRSIIFDIYKCYNDSITQNYLNNGKLDKIKPNLIFQILISIYLKCEENNIELSYKIFLISINSCKSFDEGLIWYYKYILYKYIKENELKHFSKNFNINIGSLLPEKYENNGNFKFNEFYEDNLLKLFINVEKIIIYITPFIFGINIILIDNKIKNFNYEGKSILDINESINIFYKDGNYELLYNKEYFINNKNILFHYINEENEIISQNLNKFKKDNIENNSHDKNDIKVKNIINSQKINDIKDLSILKNSQYPNIHNSNIHNSTNNLEIINNNFDNNKNIYDKEEIDLEKDRNINLNEQYIEDMLSKEKYINQNINQNICEKCNKYNKEKGFYLCKLCLNEMLDNECLLRYLLFIEQRKKEKFDINSIKFENNEYSFDELFKFSKYYPNINNYIDYIKSNICVKCKQNIEEEGYQKLLCGCYICKKCFDLYIIMMLIQCPLHPQSHFIECSIF